MKNNCNFICILLFCIVILQATKQINKDIDPQGINTSIDTMKNTTTKRNNEFKALCVRIMRGARKRGENLSLEEIIDKALACRPTGYWVNYETASRHVLKALRGTLGISRRQAHLFWLDMAKKVEQVMIQQKLPYNKALSFTVNFMRPERFYITRPHALRLLHEATREEISKGMRDFAFT